MKIVVLIKCVPDSASLLQLSADSKSIVTNELEYIINPYDEFALEEAVRLKETNDAEVIAVSMGSDQCQKVLRHALAVGADKAIWINASETENMADSLVAKVLATAVRNIEANLIFAGKQAIDCDSAQVPERVAELLDLPHISMITNFVMDGEVVTVVGQFENGYCTVETRLPALFTTEKGLNSPRYPKLPDILKSKRKEIHEVRAESLCSSANQGEPGLEILSMTLQKQTRSAHMLTGSTSEQIGQITPILKTEGVF